MIKQILFSDQNKWLDSMGSDFDTLAKQAIAEKGSFHVALSGGSTPKAFYLYLNKQKLPWKQIEFWLGDERWVPVDNSASNQKMIEETLLAGLKNSTTFHSWHTDSDPAKAAENYEKLLIKKLGTPPAIDLILLGIGTDGHTASLFPNSNALQEQKRFTSICIAPQLDTKRLTFTYPTLNQAKQIWFMVQGEEKKSVIDQLINRSPDIPSGRVQAKNQSLYWLR